MKKTLLGKTNELDNNSDNKKEKEENQKIVENIDLYKLLNVEKNATKEEIKKSFKVLALKIHPDKNQDDKEASEKFNKLHEAYKLLLDDEKRKVYDETGEIDDSLDINIENTYMFYRNIYPTITKNDIEDFATKYINSEMEKEDLIEFYNEYSGDIRDLLECIPLSTYDDVERYLKIYEELFKEKILIKNKKFLNTKSKIRKIGEDNPKEVEEERKKLNDLYSIIQARKRNRNTVDYFDSFKYKFCDGEEDKFDEIDEEEFQNLQKKRKINKKK